MGRIDRSIRDFIVKHRPCRPVRVMLARQPSDGGEPYANMRDAWERARDGENLEWVLRELRHPQHPEVLALVQSELGGRFRARFRAESLGRTHTPTPEETTTRRELAEQIRELVECPFR